MKVELIKLHDHKFNGKHPNKINVGSTKTMDDVLERTEIPRPVIGENYWFLNRNTSPVVSIKDINGNIEFETENSTYLIKFNND